MNPKCIIISRTDSIGDVMLTLPMCGVLKERFPKCRIIFLARSYTSAIVASCEHVDQYIDWDELKEASPAAQIEVLRATGADTIVHVFPRKEILWLAKRAHIATRIATGRRLYTIGKCNRLVFFSRKNSSLHESQLNVKLLRPLGIESEFTLSQIGNYYGFKSSDPIAQKKVDDYLKDFDPAKKKIVLHPLSKGSAAEWSLENFEALTKLLPANQFDVFITGTREEGARMMSTHAIRGPHVHDVTGKFSVEELIAFIQRCDALIAASTGPLHIAAALGIHAIGLYSPKRPIHPGRWAPVGPKAAFITAASHPGKDHKLAIEPAEVRRVLLSSLA